MVYLELAIAGGILFLTTAVVDYLSSKGYSLSLLRSDSPDSPTHPSQVPVGQRPSDVTSKERIKSLIKRLLTPLLGYIVAVILQIPLLLEITGVI